MKRHSVALIGSFHEPFKVMERSIGVFRENGIEVVNPLSTEMVDAEAQFVRFQTDEAAHPPEQIELLALLRILGASAVYVVCPEGYVGKTTAYEFGIVEAAQRPTYFSHSPNASFMRRQSEGRIVSPTELSGLIIGGEITLLNNLFGKRTDTDV